MGCERSRPRWTSHAVLLLWMAFILPSLQAAPFDSAEAQQPLPLQAERLEDAGQWGKAADLWYQLLVKDRSSADVKKRHQYCLRRSQQVARHQDPTYRQQVLALSLENALQVYGEILAKLQNDYVEPSKVQMPILFRQGLEELICALEEGMRQNYFGELSPEAVHDFQAELRTVWLDKQVRKAADAQNLAREIALAAKKSLGLKPSLVVLEMCCGACNALDECTYYLTPAQFNELNASLKGEGVGIGIEVSANGERVFVAQRVPGSPADLSDLKVGDQILRIGRKPVATAEAAAELLKGEPDSTVELEVKTGMNSPRLLRLKRQIVRVPSVIVQDEFINREVRIGYIQLLSFQETTVDELNLAIEKLQAQGMRALVLDLRGNPGGLFEVARQVVERFVTSGVIVCTQGRLASEFNATYHAHGTNILTVPLVVLVDGETASSAEMVAGALKENLRGKLVGKTTFGKGSIQKIKGLTSFPAGGIRMTVAKFYSPRQQSYDGAGVAPHLDIDFRPPPNMSMMPLDSQLQAAVEVARSLALGQKSDGGPN